MIDFVVEKDSSEERIRRYLLDVDEDFIPPLSFRLDLLLYSDKLSSFATNIFFKSDDEDIAHAAFYNNDKDRKNSFLSSLSVKRSVRGKGLSKELLKEVISESKLSGMHRIHLEVSPDNMRANRLYLSHGFRRVRDTNFMVLDI